MTPATPPGGAAASARRGIGRGVAFEDREEGLELGAQVLHGLGGEGAPRLRFQFARAAVLLDLLARPLDGVLLGVEQVVYQHEPPGLAPLAGAGARAGLRPVDEPGLPLPRPQPLRPPRR